MTITPIIDRAQAVEALCERSNQLNIERSTIEREVGAAVLVGDYELVLQRMRAWAESFEGEERVWAARRRLGFVRHDKQAAELAQSGAKPAYESEVLVRMAALRDALASTIVELSDVALEWDETGDLYSNLCDVISLSPEERKILVRIARGNYDVREDPCDCREPVLRVEEGDGVVVACSKCTAAWPHAVHEAMVKSGLPLGWRVKASDGRRLIEMRREMREGGEPPKERRIQGMESRFVVVDDEMSVPKPNPSVVYTFNVAMPSSEDVNRYLAAVAPVDWRDGYPVGTRVEVLCGPRWFSGTICGREENGNLSVDMDDSSRVWNVGAPSHVRPLVIDHESLRDRAGRALANIIAAETTPCAGCRDFGCPHRP